MNEYEREVALLKARRCEPCAGSGSCNNGEASTSYYESWVCENCHGSGLEPDQNKVLERRRCVPQ